jgi:hypothetical protein
LTAAKAYARAKNIPVITAVSPSGSKTLQACGTGLTDGPQFQRLQGKVLTAAELAAADTLARNAIHMGKKHTANVWIEMIQVGRVCKKSQNWNLGGRKVKWGRNLNINKRKICVFGLTSRLMELSIPTSGSKTSLGQTLWHLPLEQTLKSASNLIGFFQSLGKSRLSMSRNEVSKQMRSCNSSFKGGGGPGG